MKKLAKTIGEAKRLLYVAVGLACMCGVCFALGNTGDFVPPYINKVIKKDRMEYPRGLQTQTMTLQPPTQRNYSGTTQRAYTSNTNHQYWDIRNGNLFINGINKTTAGGGGTWGSITGTLASQTDLNTALAAKEATANKGQANGYASLGVDGKVPSAQLPTNSANNLGVLASDPASPTNGDFWFNSTAGEYRAMVNGAKKSFTLASVLEAALGLSPSGKAYGNVATDTEVAQTFTVSNTGSGAASGVTPSIVGGAPFRIYSSNIVAGAIPVGEQRTFKVGFKPTSVQSYTDTVRVAATGLANIDASLTGAGISAVAINETFDTDPFSSRMTRSSAAVKYDASNLRIYNDSNASGHTAYHNTTLASADHWVSATISGDITASHNAGLVLRHDGTNTYYRLAFKGTSIDFHRVVAGAPTFIAGINYTGGKTMATDTPYTVKASITGNRTTIYVDWNGDGDFDDTDETVGYRDDTNITTGNRVGVYLNGDSSTPYTWADNLKANAN